MLINYSPLLLVHILGKKHTCKVNKSCTLTMLINEQQNHLAKRTHFGLPS